MAAEAEVPFVQGVPASGPVKVFTAGPPQQGVEVLVSRGHDQVHTPRHPVPGGRRQGQGRPYRQGGGGGGGHLKVGRLSLGM